MKRFLLFLFLFGVSIPLNAVEVGSMHGGLKAIGADRPADILENPALLSFPATKAKNALLLRDSLSYYLAIQNPLYGDNIVSGLLANVTSFGYARLNDKKGKLSFGVFFNNEFRSIFEEMSYYQPYETIIPSNMTVTDHTMDVIFNPLGFNAGIGGSLKISESHSIGLSALFTYVTSDYKRSFLVKMVNTGLGLTGYTTQSDQTLLTRIRAGIILGYVNHMDMGELTLSVNPFTYQVDHIKRNLYYLYNLNGTVIDKVDSSTSYKNNTIAPIPVRAGISQKLFPFMKMYVEGEVLIPIRQEYKTDELYTDSSGTAPYKITFKVIEMLEFSPTVKTGFVFFLKNDFNIHTGFSLFSGAKTMYYSNPKNDLDNIAKTYSTLDYLAQLGFSKLFGKNFLTYLSFAYLYATDKIFESKYVGGNLNDYKYKSYISRIDVNAGVEYLF